MKNVIITGASSGIGKELAKVFAKNGWSPVLVARSENLLKQLKEDLEEEYKVKAYVIPMDLTSENAAKDLFDAAAELEIDIDCLVNNAGRGELSKFLEADLSTYQQVLQLNIGVLTDLCYLFAKHVKERNGNGKILNVASTAAFQAIPNMAVYAATKAYVLSLSESLALELKKENISVTALCPGPTRTDFVGAANVNSFAESLPIFQSAKEVAEFGYKKMMNKQAIAIPGVLNRIGANSNRFLPRKGVSMFFGEVMNLGKK